ncbi:MAG: mersacidin/lichenicidin family type 2 lantibiotic [Bryobacteraceae bacterium]
MSTQHIIRAWKDEEYRRSLSNTERAALPENPAGVTELSDSQAKQAAGGFHAPPPAIRATFVLCTHVFSCI